MATPSSRRPASSAAIHPSVHPLCRSVHPLCCSVILCVVSVSQRRLCRMLQPRVAAALPSMCPAVLHDPS
eukprot:6432926-Prymnesium_polylepis.3